MAKILLIEDEEALRNGMRALLERRGHTVYIYTRGDGAVEYAKKLCPNITLTDHNLGISQKTGLSIARALIANNQRAILTSGDSAVKNPALDSGVPFIEKGRPMTTIKMIEEALL